jgi:hypothetical protein
MKACRMLVAILLSLQLQSKHLVRTLTLGSLFDIYSMSSRYLSFPLDDVKEHGIGAPAML